MTHDTNFFLNFSFFQFQPNKLYKSHQKHSEKSIYLTKKCPNHKIFHQRRRKRRTKKRGVKNPNKMKSNSQSKLNFPTRKYYELQATTSSWLYRKLFVSSYRICKLLGIKVSLSLSSSIFSSFLLLFGSEWMEIDAETRVINLLN